MKKITMLLAFLLAFAAESYAQFPESFEGTTFPPAGWASFRGTNGAGTGQDWHRVTDDFSTGTASAFVRYENVTDGPAEDWLVTPQVAITASNSNLSFFQREGYPDDEYGTTYTVRVSTTSQTDIASFTTIETMSEDDVPGAFGPMNIDLSAYVGQSIYVAFVMSQDDGDNWYIDDVDFNIMVAAPECVSAPTPADTAVDIPTGVVTFSWTPSATGGTPTGYDMYYGETADDVTNFVGSFTDTSVDITLTGYDTTFYWMIVPKNSGGYATGCSVWSFTTVAAPAVPDNDACSSAIAVTAFPYTNTQDAFSATNNDGFITSCADVGGMNDGVWYTVTGNGFDLTVDITNVVGWDPQVDIYTGTCGTFTCVASADSGGGDGNETIGFSSALGTTYYINVGQYSDTTDNPEGTFTINVTSATNDTPDYANLQYPVDKTILQGESFEVYGQAYEANLTDVEPGLSGQADGIEMWVAVSTENTDPSTWDDAAWMEGEFNAAHISANDEYMATIGADLDPGTYYYATRWSLNNGPYVYGGITTGGEGGAWDGTTYNSGVLTVNAPPAPANDECAAAIPLTPGGDFAGGAITTTNYGATATDTATCQTQSGENVWYSVVVPASGTLTVETGGATGSTFNDSVITVYSGTCDSLTEIDCDDDGGTLGGELFSRLELSGLTPGETLYVSVWRYNYEFADGTWGEFQLSAYDASLATNHFDSNSFAVYPNPVRNVLNLTSNLADISNVAVFNLLGQQVIAKQVNAAEGQVDMSSLPRGTYMVKVTANNQVKTIKVIKE
jgi:hypothetical protein